MTSPANPNPLLAEAEKEKAQGNKFFQQQLYNPAVEHYTLAIRATPEGHAKLFFGVPTMPSPALDLSR